MSLVFSSGAVGALARKLLQGQGYVPSVEAGIALTFGLAAFFAAAQIAYLAFMRLAAPSRGTAPLFFETLSNAAALTFVPYLAGLSFIPALKAHLGGSGADLLEKVQQKLAGGLLEPAVLFGAFLAVHCFLKLVSFFSATESRPASRLPAFAWAGAAALCGFGGLLALERWAHALDAARNVPLAEPKAVAIDGVYAQARSLPMGADLVIPLEGHAGESFTLNWALARDYDFPPTELHVTVRLDNGAPFLKTIPLGQGGWIPLRPFSEPLPAEVKTCTLSWDFAQDSALLLKWGIRRPPADSDVVWVTTPSFALPANGKMAPNFVVLAIDGLASARMKSQGYPRDTTPVIDNLTKSAMFFPGAIAPAPEPVASCATLLTGRSPLTHGFLGKQAGPLPANTPTLAELLRAQHYATAAFTESDWAAKPDLAFGSGLERGFDLFDPTTPLEAARKGTLPGAPAPPEHAGTERTLATAGAWIDQHAQDRFFLFARLREAGDPAPLARYGAGFITNHAKPDPGEVYDTALNAVDKALPAFLDHLNARGLADNTVLVITGTCGLDPEHTTPAQWAHLSDATLMVPLLIVQPGKSGKSRPALAPLQDLAPTLLQMLDPKPAILSDDPAKKIDGGFMPLPSNDLLGYNASSEAISLSGTPLIATLRDRRYRFYTNTGLDLTTHKVTGPQVPLALINLEQSRIRSGLVDELAHNPTEVQRAQAAVEKVLRATN